MTSTGTEIDQARAEAFSGRMLDILNGASLTFMVAIGHETGLLDRLADLPPSTSGQLASIVGLNERYVREWLGAMVTGRIVDYDPDSATYALPPEHAACLTRAAGTNNMSSIAAFFPPPNLARLPTKWPAASGKAAACPTPSTEASRP